MKGYYGYDDDNDYDNDNDNDDDNSNEECWPFEGASDYFETPHEAWEAFNEYVGEDADNDSKDYF